MLVGWDSAVWVGGCCPLVWCAVLLAVGSMVVSGSLLAVGHMGVGPTLLVGWWAGLGGGGCLSAWWGFCYSLPCTCVL